MHCPSKLCKLALAGVNDNDDNQQKEFNSNDNGKDDLAFS